MASPARVRRLLPRPSIIAAFAIAMVAAPLDAQPKADPPPDYLARLVECRQLADEQQRLGCFDAAVANLVEARDAGEVRVVREAEMERTRRGLFGFSLPKFGLFGSDEEQLDMLESTVTSVRRVGRDGYRFVIEEGSVWQISDAPRRFRAPEPGDAVVFKRAALGSFFIRVDGQLGVKGKRVE